MESFNENLGNLLSGCRDDVLEELRSNKRYMERKQAQSDIRSKLEAIISTEAQTLLEEYAVSVITLNGIEFNRVMLCGLTMTAALRKRFDVSAPEYTAFAEEYLS
jgi:hypothetical protein